MRKVASVAPASKLRCLAWAPNRRSASRSSVVAGPSNCIAVSVGVMALPARTSSASPVRARRRRSWALTCGWLLPRRMAARETLRSLIKVCNTRMR